jgi:hypothetical protein
MFGQSIKAKIPRAIRQCIRNDIPGDASLRQMVEGRNLASEVE